jgi:menaquinone-dependent protoporphyrinogen oxidase
MRPCRGRLDDGAMIDERPSVLVAYASRHGSTRQVAETVALHLRERGWRARVRAAATVTDVSEYRAVVLGAALYMGRLHPDARAMLRRHHQRLAVMPLAVFAMGPGSSSEHDLAASLKQLDAGLSRFQDLAPLETAVFGGVVDPTALHFPFNHMPASDARDWDEIAAFAGRVAEAFVDATAKLPS